MRTILLLALVLAGCEGPCPVYDPEDPECEGVGDGGDPGPGTHVARWFSVTGTNASAWVGQAAVVQIHDELPSPGAHSCLKAVVSSAGTFFVEEYLGFSTDATYAAYVVLNADGNDDYDPGVDSAWTMPFSIQSDIALFVDAQAPTDILPTDDVCDAVTF